MINDVWLSLIIPDVKDCLILSVHKLSNAFRYLMVMFY
jgi:hypothetical protein